MGGEGAPDKLAADGHNASITCGVCYKSSYEPPDSPMQNWTLINSVSISEYMAARGCAALVIIDVQKGFEDPEWGDRNNLDAEANIAQLLEAWRAAGWPVHHVRHVSRSPLGKFRLGTPGHDPKNEAQALPGEQIHLKEVNSGFIGTDLERALRSQGVTTVVFAGLTTNHCVSTTVRMAANLEFGALLVSDATATFARLTLGGRVRSADEVHEAALSDLNDEFAKIVSTKEILAAVGHNQAVEPFAD